MCPVQTCRWSAIYDAMQIRQSCCLPTLCRTWVMVYYVKRICILTTPDPTFCPQGYSWPRRDRNEYEGGVALLVLSDHMVKTGTLPAIGVDLNWYNSQQCEQTSLRTKRCVKRLKVSTFYWSHTSLVRLTGSGNSFGCEGSFLDNKIDIRMTGYQLPSR